MLLTWGFSEGALVFASQDLLSNQLDSTNQKFLLQSIPAVATKLEIRSIPEISGGRVLFSDVFHCYGRNENCERFYGLDMGKLPQPGSTITLYKKDIMEIINREQIHLPIEFQGNFPVKIMTPFVMLESDIILKYLKDHIDSLMNENISEVKIDLIDLHISKQIKLPLADMASFVFPDLASFEDITKIFKIRKEQAQISVKILASNDFEAVTGAYVRYRVWQKLPVAVRDIAVDEEVSELDINYEWRQSQVGTPIPVSFAQKETEDSWVAIQVIRRGQPIFMGQVERPVCVVNQSEVDVLIKSGAVEVKTKGKALRKASKGEHIYIEMLGNSRKVLAKVIDIGLVEVDM